jgi:hypothetical protein
MKSNNSLWKFHFMSMTYNGDSDFIKGEEAESHPYLPSIQKATWSNMTRASEQNNRGRDVRDKSK